MWQIVTGVAVAVGLTALMSRSFGLTFSVWLMCFSMLGTLRVTLEPDDAIGRRVVAAAVSFGARWGTLATSAIGLIQLGGWAGAALVALLTLTAPQTLGLLVLRRPGAQVAGRGPLGLRRSSATVAGPGSAERDLGRPIPAELEPPLAVSDNLTDHDLCLAWRSSYVALLRAETPESRLRAVAIRAVILDELDRRNQPGLQAWLSSGARAASDPGPHLLGPHP